MAPPLTLAQASQGGTARDLLLILATAGIVALVFNRFRLSTIPGFLIAGAAIGPHGFALIGSVESVQSISQLSTILLMFVIGLQLDIARVRSSLFSIITATILATFLAVLLGWPVAYAFVGGAPAALVIAMAMSAAATAVPLRMLEDRKDLHTNYGRLAFGITLFQDLLAVGMLATLPVIAHWAGVALGDAQPSEGRFLAVASAVAIAIGGIALLVLAGRLVLPRLLAEAGRVGGEVLIVISAAVALGAAVLTAALGFSPELGAFLAGFLLASTPFRFQISGQMIPMRDLFLAVFFTAVGLGLPVGTVFEGWWIVILAVIALGLIKIASIASASWAMGASAPFGLLAAVTLAPAGEFTLVLLAQAGASGILSQTQAGYGASVVVVSIITAPIIFNLGHRAAPLLRRVPPAPWIAGRSLHPRPTEPPASEPSQDAAPEEGAPAPASCLTVIAGFGPVGRAVTDALEKRGITVTVIELNPRTVERQHLLGRAVLYGDASNPEVLEQAGIRHASAVVLTMPDEESVLRSCRVVRALRPDIFIAARLNTLARALQAMQLGADHTVVEEMATAEAMASQVMTKVQQLQSGEDMGPRLYDVRG